MNPGSMFAQQAPETDTRDHDTIIAELKTAYAHLTTERPPLKPGDIVKHVQPEMADTRMADLPAIVVEVLTTPILPREMPEGFDGAGDWFTTSATNRLDIVIGHSRPCGTFSTFFADSRWYEVATK